MNNLTKTFLVPDIKSVEGEILENKYMVRVHFEIHKDRFNFAGQFKEELEKRREIWGGEQLSISDKSSKETHIEEISFAFLDHAGRMGFMSEIMTFGEALANLGAGTVHITTSTRPIPHSLLLDKPREKPLPTPQLS